jgi:hypothetical protein
VSLAGKTDSDPEYVFVSKPKILGGLLIENENNGVNEEMRSIDLMIKRITRYLVKQNPHEAQQFIIDLFAQWAERQYGKQAGDDLKLAAARKFLSELRSSLDQGLEQGKIYEYSPSPFKLLKVFKGRRGKLGQEVLDLMNCLSADEAMSFLAELTSAWSHSLPESQISQLAVPPTDHSKQAVSDAVYEWFVRYFDMWT